MLDRALTRLRPGDCGWHQVMVNARRAPGGFIDVG